MSYFVHFDNKENDILILGAGPAKKLDGNWIFTSI